MNSIKISVKRTDYYVNEKKQTVTCVLTFDVNCSSEQECIMIDAGIRYTDMYNITANATAKVSEYDTFDIERGKKVALAKAEMQAYRLARNLLIKARNKIQRVFMNEVEVFRNKAALNILHNVEYIDANF